MASQKIQLRIDTPTGPIKSGRGFYQLDEESLFIQIGLFTEKKHFFNKTLERTYEIIKIRIAQLILK